MLRNKICGFVCEVKATSGLGELSKLWQQTQKKLEELVPKEMVEKERKEHPMFTDEQVEQIVKDHLKEGKKKDLDVPQPMPPALRDVTWDKKKEQPFVENAKYDTEHDFLPDDIRAKLQQVLEQWRSLAFPTEGSSGVLKDKSTQKI